MQRLRCALVAALARFENQSMEHRRPCRGTTGGQKEQKRGGRTGEAGGEEGRKRGRNRKGEGRPSGPAAGGGVAEKITTMQI